MRWLHRDLSPHQQWQTLIYKDLPQGVQLDAYIQLLPELGYQKLVIFGGFQYHQSLKLNNKPIFSCTF